MLVFYTGTLITYRFILSVAKVAAASTYSVENQKKKMTRKPLTAE